MQLLAARTDGLGGEQLGLGRRERVVLAAALEVGRAPRHQPGRVELDGGVGDELLHQLVGGDLLAELLALGRVARPSSRGRPA
jgi:hypothetical protein